MLVSIVNGIYFLYIFLPIILIFLKKKYLQKIRDYIKYIFFVYLITPLFWILCDGNCLLTKCSKWVGYYQDGNLSNFNEKYLKIIYKPIMIVFNMDYNDHNIFKITGMLSFIPSILFYYICFFRIFE